MSLERDAPPLPFGVTAPFSLGELLAGKYRVERMLGEGGMGFVLLATHLELDQLVAIKLMREEGLKSPDARARFAREAKAVVRLKSEHVARVLDVGTLENGAPFLVMEYLEGDDLATILEELGGHGLAVEEAVAYLLQVCEGVAEAHGSGIVHRDLKPRNIFVTTGVDGKPLLKVLDFGISKLLPAEGATVDIALTRTRDVMGSPAYMAPEQLRSARDTDERADIWSLGVMLYEMVTGKLPWEAESMTELGAMVLRDALRPMRALTEGVPSALDDVVARCLQKDRADRFPSVVELAHALEPHSRGLAAGSAERITSVAHTSRNPPAARGASLRDRPSSSSSARVVASGGTSVSWADTELQPPPPPIAPRPRLSPAVIGLCSVLVVGLASGAYALATRATSTATAPPLPEDRGAIRPPATASTTPPTAPPTTPVVTAATESARPPPTGMAAPPLSAVPRRAPSGASPSSTATTAPAEPVKAAAGSAPKSPDAHDMGSIPRK